MDFSLSSEDSMIRKSVREWVSKECPADMVRDRDENSEHPGDLLSRLSGLGFYGLIVEEAYGGEGKNVLATCIIIMEIASRYPALAKCYSIDLLGGMLLSNWGSREQKETYLPKLLDGKIQVATRVDGNFFGAAGPGIRGQWMPESNQYVLNGSLDAVENADHSGLLIVPVKLEDGEKQESAYMLLETNNQNIQCLPGPERMGYKGINACTVACNNLAVPQESVLGGTHTAAADRQQSMAWDLLLLLTAFEALGIAKGAYDAALNYVKQRVQFNRPIGKFPAVRRMISEMQKEIQASELLSLRAGWKSDQGDRFAQESTLAAWSSICTAQKAAEDGLQLFGGYGYTMEYDIQRYFRDITVLMNSATAYELLSHRIGKAAGLS
ncbi:MAG: acyl-CoA dehydrogenase family protein [Desulfobacteraceae bacterium]|nr:acyl-CoA dehydrogenase family protein [Desulfobacteraceae bacterium]